MELTKIVKSTIAAAGIAIIATGCASTDSKAAYQADLNEFRNERPSLEYTKMGDASVDKFGESSTTFYSSSVKHFEDYDNKTSAYADVKEKMDAQRDFKEKNIGKDVPAELILSADETTSSNERMKLVEGMDWSEIGDLVVKGGVMGKTGAEMLANCKGFDMTTLKKANALKDATNKIKFSVSALDFLLEQRSQMKAQANQ